MDAEILDGINRRPDKARVRYQTAIRMTQERNLLRDQALAHHRYSEFLYRQHDLEPAYYHFQEAVEWYEAWGAHSVADYFRSSYGAQLHQSMHEEKHPKVSETTPEMSVEFAP